MLPFCPLSVKEALSKCADPHREKAFQPKAHTHLWCVPCPLLKDRQTDKGMPKMLQCDLGSLRVDQGSLSGTLRQNSRLDTRKYRVQGRRRARERQTDRQMRKTEIQRKGRIGRDGRERRRKREKAEGRRERKDGEKGREGGGERERGHLAV